MEINLNDTAFSNSKQGDIFIVEVKKNKKYARPITKEELFKEEIETFKKLKEEIIDLKKQSKEQAKKIEEYCSSIHKFIEIMKGE